MRRVRICAAMAMAMAMPLGACEKKRGERPPPSAKPISPPAIEPLPAPRARGRLPSPAGTPPGTQPATPAGPDTETPLTAKLDAGTSR